MSILDLFKRNCEKLLFIIFLITNELLLYDVLTYLPMYEFKLMLIF